MIYEVFCANQRSKIIIHRNWLRAQAGVHIIHAAFQPDVYVNDLVIRINSLGIGIEVDGEMVAVILYVDNLSN